MKPVNDVIHKDMIIKQLQYFMQGRRALLSQSCGNNNAIGTAYDAGYLACLTELEYIIMNPPKDQDKADLDDPDFDEDDDE